MIWKEVEERAGYFIGDPDHYVFDKKGKNIELVEFDVGIYRTQQGDIYVVGEKERVNIIGFGREELTKRSVKYLRLAGKVILGKEIEIEGMGENIEIVSVGEGREVEFSGIKKIH